MENKVPLLLDLLSLTPDYINAANINLAIRLRRDLLTFETNGHPQEGFLPTSVDPCMVGIFIAKKLPYSIIEVAIERQMVQALLHFTTQRTPYCLNDAMIV